MHHSVLSMYRYWRSAKRRNDEGFHVQAEYQYLFCRGSGHGVGNAQAQFLPHALEWVWKGYAPKKDKYSSRPKLLTAGREMRLRRSAYGASVRCGAAVAAVRVIINPRP